MVTLRSELSLRPHLCQQYKPLYVPSGAQAKGPRCCDSLDSDLILPIIIITCLHDSQGMNLAFLNSCHIVFLSRKTKVDFPLVSNILVHYRKLQSMIPNTTTTFKKKKLPVKGVLYLRFTRLPIKRCLSLSNYKFKRQRGT